MSDKIKTYKSAGVDIEKGDRFAKLIKNIKSEAILKSLGGFSGGIELEIKNYQKPVLLSTTDGVGTKLLIAKKLNDYSTVGIDLVAMCINDLLVCGAKPLLFLDYIACGQLNEAILMEVMEGIVKGCEKARVKLAGGETAELPDMYNTDDLDLAGFAVGIADKKNILPQVNKIEKGDYILGIPSNGIHSNGFSLARKVIPESDSRSQKELLIPTKIYSNEMEIVLKTGKVLAAAHITGGGIIGNLKRIIPDKLDLKLYNNWNIPGIFKTIQEYGKITDEEMSKVFNMGIGICIIVKRDIKGSIVQFAQSQNILLMHIV